MNVFDNLNIPGIDITGFRSFQYRTKGWRVEGYNPSRPEKRKSREYRLNINGFKAWKIRFRNRHKTPVNITLYFRIQGKYVPGYDYKQTCSNLLPEMESEMVVIPGLKTAKVRLDKVEVHSGTNLLSTTEVKTFMPYWRGNSVFSFITAFVLGVGFLFWQWHGRNAHVHGEGIQWIAVIGCCLVFLEFYNITPGIIMVLLLLAAPYFFLEPLQLAALFVLGCLYIWAVWRKRASVKDFLIGAFIP